MTEIEWQPARWEFPSGDGFEEVPGLYRVQPNGAAEARIHGTVARLPAIAHDLFDNPPRLLHGRLMNKAVTLVDTSGLRSNSGLSTIQDVALEPRYAIEGEAVAADRLALTTVNVTFTTQEDWTRWSVFQPATPEEQEEGYRVRRVEPQAYEAKALGCRIRLIDASTSSQKNWPKEWVFRSASRFVLEFENPTAIDDILDQWVTPLLLLLSSASGQAVGVESLEGVNRDWSPRNANESAPRWVTLRVSKPDEPTNPRKAHDYLHHLHDFDYERQIPLLFDAASRCRYAAFRTLSLWEETSPSHVEHFIRTFQVTEALGRALHPGINKEHAILGQMNKDVDLLVNSLWGNGSWINSIRDLRDVATHSLQTAHDFLGDVRALQGATVLLTMLLEASWLVAVGFSAPQAKDFIERRGRYGWQAKIIKETQPLIKAIKK